MPNANMSEARHLRRNAEVLRRKQRRHRAWARMAAGIAGEEDGAALHRQRSRDAAADASTLELRAISLDGKGN